MMQGVSPKRGKKHAEDIIGHKDNVYWLLDGATMPEGLFRIPTLEYTEMLSQAIENNVSYTDPKEILRHAIKEVKKHFTDRIDRSYVQPSSTAVIVVVTDKVQYGVLGDSTLYINGKAITDNRLQKCAIKERERYRNTRTEDDRKNLVRKEYSCRNKDYFIAEFDPDAADEMICGEEPKGDILLMSDGLSLIADRIPYEEMITLAQEGTLLNTLRRYDNSDDASFLLIG